MSALFSPDNKPTKGTPKLLWDWFTNLNLPNKAVGVQPDSLFHQTIGRFSSPSSASYTIMYQGDDYAIYSAKEARAIVRWGYELEWGEATKRYSFYVKDSEVSA